MDWPGTEPHSPGNASTPHAEVLEVKSSLCGSIVRSMNSVSLPLASWSQITDDITWNILVLVSPHPVTIARIAAVCRTWRSIVRTSKFLRRLMEHHEVTPLMGFFTNVPSSDRFLPFDQHLGVVGVPRFTLPILYPDNRLPTLSTSHWEVLACRHGKVLLLGGAVPMLLVWDPITGHQTLTRTHSELAYVHGTVVCVAHHHHGNCHSSPWVVVWIVSTGREIKVRRWSSVTQACNIPQAQVWFDGLVDFRPSTLIGDVLYWHLTNNFLIAFDMAENLLHPIELPEAMPSLKFRRHVHVVPLDDDVLGLAVLNTSVLEIWSRVGGINEGSSWAMNYTIPLLSIMPIQDDHIINHHRPQGRIVCVMEDRKVILIRAADGVYEVDYQRKTSTKIMGETPRGTMFAYESFYIAGVAGVDEA
ncbi:unnamed protein product [Triticum turgidum subsp. durum]|uniref:F-box domain-containing protein n=2 Tax=Triticum TaxID=4564 RepID=A0A9R1B929_TRITD|nr:unnamed protein product [Triticum turgidum subsp. durum]